MQQDYSSVDNNSSYDVFVDADVVMVNQIVIVFCLLYTPFVIISNLFLLCGLLLYPGFQEPFDYFLLSLAVSHLLVGAFSIPMYVLSYLEYTRTALMGNKYTCLLWLSSVMLAGAASIHCLLLIAIDRCTAVAFPAAYRDSMTRKTAMVTIVIMWCYVLILAFLPMLGCNRFRSDIVPLRRRCSISTALPRGYVLLVSYVFNSAIMAVACVLCFCTLFISIRHKRNIMKYSQRNSEKAVQQLQLIRDSINTTFILVILFLLLWLPSLLLEPFRYYNIFTPKINEIFQLVAQAIRFSCSLFNVSVYSAFKTEYREVLGLMFNTLPWKWRTELQSLHGRHSQSFPVEINSSFFSNSSLFGPSSFTCSSVSEESDYIFNKFEESVALRRLSLYSAMNRSIRNGNHSKHEKEMFLAMLMMDNKRDLKNGTESDTYLSLRQQVAKHGTCIDHMTGKMLTTPSQEAQSQPELHRETDMELQTRKSLKLHDKGKYTSWKGGGLANSDPQLPLKPCSSVDRKFSLSMRQSQFFHRMSMAAIDVMPRKVSNEELDDVESTVDPIQLNDADNWFWNEGEPTVISNSNYSLQETLDKYMPEAASHPFS